MAFACSLKRKRNDHHHVTLIPSDLPSTHIFTIVDSVLYQIANKRYLVSAQYYMHINIQNN